MSTISLIAWAALCWLLASLIAGPLVGLWLRAAGGYSAPPAPAEHTRGLRQ